MKWLKVPLEMFRTDRRGPTALAPAYPRSEVQVCWGFGTPASVRRRWEHEVRLILEADRAGLPMPPTLSLTVEVKAQLRRTPRAPFGDLGTILRLAERQLLDPLEYHFVTANDGGRYLVGCTLPESEGDAVTTLAALLAWDLTPVFV